MEVKEAYIKEKSKNSFIVKLFNVHVPSGKRIYREHKHSMFEIVLIKSGTGIYTTKTNTYSIAPGDVFVFASNEEHCITMIDEKSEMCLMNLHFEPRYFWGNSIDSFTDSNLFFEHNTNFKNRLPRENKAKIKIATLLRNIESEFYSKKPEYKMMIRACITNIMITLLRELDYKDRDCDTPHNTTSIKSIKKAMDYIHKNLTEKITLEEIANRAGMSPSYFSTVFKNTVGETLWDYVTEKRIETAMRMLEKDEGDSMLDIALQCGFNNTANFNKAFRKHTGKTPREYKVHGKAALY